jgi:hypothetical protein
MKDLSMNFMKDETAKVNSRRIGWKMFQDIATDSRWLLATVCHGSPVNLHE